MMIWQSKPAWIALLLAATLGMETVAQGATLADVPASLVAARRPPLVAERERIRTAAVALQAQIARLAGPCAEVDAGTPLDAECRELVAQRSVYEERVKRFNRTVREALTAQAAAQRAAIAADEQAIRQLDAGSTVAQLEDWVNLSQSAASERDRQIKEALRESAQAIVTTVASEALGRLAQGAASLNPPTVNRLIGRLRAAGVDNAHLEEMLRAIGNTKDKPAKLKRAKELVDLLKRETAIWNLSDMDHDSESAKWKAGSEIIGLFVPDPRLKLLGKLTLQEVRIVFYTANSAIVGRVSLGHIERLSTLSADKLVALKVLSAKVERDVAALRATLADLRKIDAT